MRAKAFGIKLYYTHIHLLSQTTAFHREPDQINPYTMLPAKATKRNSPPLSAAKRNTQRISESLPASRLKTPPDTSQSDPVFFFKANEDNGIFCQWYPATFTVAKQEMSDLVGQEIDPADPWTLIYFNCA